MAKIFLTNTGDQIFVAPSDWPGTATSIECIGPGGGGSGGEANGGYGQGGGGGAYSKKNGPVTIANGAFYHVGIGGLGRDKLFAHADDGEDTWFGAATYASAICAAKGGKGGSKANADGLTTGAGGAASAGIGDVNFSGGTGTPGGAVSAGGGAGGPIQAGGWGGFGSQQVQFGGPGGGAGDGSSGGSTFTFTKAPGGTSVNGGGKGGDGGEAPGDAENGGNGTEFDATHGSGGGGGGGAASANGFGWLRAGNGGLYGGGGGGAIDSGDPGQPSQAGGNGAQGLIVITYTPVTTTKTITVTLINESGVPRSNLSALKWAFWDYATPALIFSNTAAPSASGASGSTNALGVFTAAVSLSSLTAGQYGWLVITNSDGTLSQSPKHSAFSGPVVVRVA